MNFIVAGVFKMDRKPNGHIDDRKESKAKFWKTVECDWKGLKDASGCYVFALNTGRGPIPWYVGKAERQSFEDEIFTLHKLHHYNDVVIEHKGTPYVFLMPRVTSRQRLCRPAKNHNASIRLLETLMIGMALRRNPQLKNIKDTSLLRSLSLRGVVNSNLKGHPGGAAVALKKTLRLG
jgi:hypothetical protein